MKESYKIVLVEDDIDLGRLLKLYLEMESFAVCLCESAEVALKVLESESFDLAVVDVTLPGINGFDFAEMIREHDQNMPFIFLTARKQKDDRLRGLKLGADDYITKPFDADELILRIRNILKRSGRMEMATSRIGDFEIQFDELKLVHPSATVSLTRREAELLQYLINHQGRLIKTSEILIDLWGENDYFLGRSMNVFISRIRKFLKADPRIIITNIRGVGYEIKVIETGPQSESRFDVAAQPVK
jgi:two-component system, OmpR family, response regulator TrcR